jgi:hypothetical protein
VFGAERIIEASPASSMSHSASAISELFSLGISEIVCEIVLVGGETEVTEEVVALSDSIAMSQSQSLGHVITKL